MEQRSPGGRAEEWRLYWLSGQYLCRTSTGAAFRGGFVTFNLATESLAQNDTESDMYGMYGVCSMYVCVP